MKKWNCELKKPPKKITVGTKLQLSCEGDISKSLENKKLSIVFPKKEDAYRLNWLKTLYVEKEHIDLEVTPYRTGAFKDSFTITDGRESFVVEELSFNVVSVLPKDKPVQAHGAFGPWKEPVSLLYLSFFGLASILFLLVIIVLFQNYFKRKRLSERVKKRLQGHWPSKIFIKKLRKLNKDSSNYVSDLEILFKIFLENLLCVSALKKKPSQILHSLRKYEPLVYKKHSSKIRQILKEMEEFKDQKEKDNVKFQLEKTCKELVFLLEEERK